MDDSIIAVIAAISIGIIQLVVSANKKKRAKERIVRSWAQEERYGQGVELEEWEEMEEQKEEVSVPFRMMMPKEEHIEPEKPMMEIKDVKDESETIEETEPILYGFTPKKAILFTEVLNPKWNS